jgi:myo-inositol-1-phosphate synthase
MFSLISWSQYCIVVAIVIAIYFIVIGFLYYKKDIVKLFGRAENRESFAFSSVSNTEKTDPIFTVHELVSSLGELMRDAADKKQAQPEMFYAMKQLVKNYPMINGTNFVTKINTYIQEELERYGTHTLSDEELVQLWR